MTMTTWKTWLPALTLLGFICFSGAGLHQWLHSRSFAALAREGESLMERIRTIEGEPDHQKAVRHYTALAQDTPEIRLRILQRQWAMAVEKMTRIRKAKTRQTLNTAIPAFYEDLTVHLSEMADGCRSALAGPGFVREETAWRIHNIRGCVSVMQAFVTSLSERNEKKVAGRLRSAISEFAAAIHVVDGAAAAADLRNIPRWNLALITEKEWVQQFHPTPMAEDRRLDLQKNLETVIPETGGYAPGAPVEDRFAK